MGEILNTLLGNKPLSDWQHQVIEEGRLCKECGAQATVTPPLSDSEMVRIACSVCGYLSHEFKPAGEVVPFPAVNSDCQ